MKVVVKLYISYQSKQYITFAEKNRN